MLKFQPPMSNNEVCRMATDKQTYKHTSVYFSQIVLLNFGSLRRRHFFVWPQFLALEDDKASYDAYEMRNGCKIEWSGCRPKPLHRRAT